MLPEKERVVKLKGAAEALAFYLFYCSF